VLELYLESVPRHQDSHSADLHVTAFSLVHADDQSIFLRAPNEIEPA